MQWVHTLCTFTTFKPKQKVLWLVHWISHWTDHVINLDVAQNGVSPGNVVNAVEWLPVARHSKVLLCWLRIAYSLASCRFLNSGSMRMAHKLQQQSEYRICTNLSREQLLLAVILKTPVTLCVEQRNVHTNTCCCYYMMRGGRWRELPCWIVDSMPKSQNI